MDRSDIPDDDDDDGGCVRARPPAGLLRLGLLDLLLPLVTPSLDFDFGIDDDLPISPGRGAGVRRPPRIPNSAGYSAVSKVEVLTPGGGRLAVADVVDGITGWRPACCCCDPPMTNDGNATNNKGTNEKRRRRRLVLGKEGRTSIVFCFIFF